MQTNASEFVTDADVSGSYIPALMHFPRGRKRVRVRPNAFVEVFVKDGNQITGFYVKKNKHAGFGWDDRIKAPAPGSPRKLMGARAWSSLRAKKMIITTADGHQWTPAGQESVRELEKKKTCTIRE